MKCVSRLMIVLLMTFWSVPLFGQEEFKEWADDTAAPLTREAPAAQFHKEHPGSSTAFVRKEAASAPGTGNLYWLVAIALATVVAGVLVRFRTGRKARPFFLVASVAILGFYRGSYPCPVGGFQEGLLFIKGAGGGAGWLWWFVVLLPLTYWLGKVWCGWVCHLGALQELLYKPGLFQLLASARAQKVLRYIRLGALLALVSQLALTHSLWWKQVDPFKTAFNLMASHSISWILLGVVLSSSVFMFRPFCRALCPVGLVLGWISKIPGAAGVGIKEDCIGCKACSTACHSHALTRDQDTVALNRQDCVACGECMDACPLHGLGIFAHKGTASTTVLHTGKNKEGSPAAIARAR